MEFEKTNRANRYIFVNNADLFIGRLVGHMLNASIYAVYCCTLRKIMQYQFIKITLAKH